MSHTRTGARRGRRRPTRAQFRVRRALVLAALLAVVLGAGYAVDSFVTSGQRAGASAQDRLEPGGTAASSPSSSGRSPSSAAPPSAPDETPAAVQPAPAPDPRTPADVQVGLLSLEVPVAASGALVVVPGQVPAPGPGPVRTVRVEVEAGLPVDPEMFATFVLATLNDPRSWGADGAMSFARTDGEAQLRVVLGSAALVDDLCAPLRTRGTASCGHNGYAALNYLRWVTGTPEFADDLLAYRQYVVNHEVGHLLGHGHRSCPGAGQVAPVMQQQTYGVAPCLANGWPLP